MLIYYCYTSIYDIAVMQRKNHSQEHEAGGELCIEIKRRTRAWSQMSNGLDSKDTNLFPTWITNSHH